MPASLNNSRLFQVSILQLCLPRPRDAKHKLNNNCIPCAVFATVSCCPCVYVSFSFNQISTID